MEVQTPFFPDFSGIDLIPSLNVFELFTELQREIYRILLLFQLKTPSLHRQLPVNFFIWCNRSPAVCIRVNATWIKGWFLLMCPLLCFA